MRIGIYIETNAHTARRKYTVFCARQYESLLVLPDASLQEGCEITLDNGIMALGADIFTFSSTIHIQLLNVSITFNPNDN
jgi:hypothetical protein